MTKKELLDKMYVQHGDLTKKKVDQVVGDVFEVMVQALKDGEKVAWAGFGAFTKVERPARKGRNPKTGVEMELPASRTVKFKVSGTLKEKL